jgi:tRNA G18 (ribose-2'-O)-methylase SpoU
VSRRVGPLGLLFRAEWYLRGASIALRHHLATRHPTAPDEDRPHPFVLVGDHLHPRYNPGRLIRTAEVLGAAAVYLIGVPRFDPGLAAGALDHLPVHHLDDRQACFDQLRARGYELMMLATPHGHATEPLEAAPLPARAAFVLGNEGTGLPYGPADVPDARWLSIQQSGAGDSLDVCSAAAIAAWAWTCQHAAPRRP